MTQKITDIVDKLKRTHKLIQIPDSCLHEKYKFAGQDAFYVWGNNTHKDSIVKLLKGKEVILNANIKNREISVRP